MSENWFELLVEGTPEGVLFKLGLDDDFKKKVMESESAMDSVIFSAITAFLIEFAQGKGLDFSLELERASREYYSVNSETSVLEALLKNISLKTALDNIENKGN